MSPTTKKILIAVVVLIIAMIVYGVFFRGNTPAAPTSGLTSASGSTATAPSAGQLPPDQERINREFLVRLLNLNNIKLNSDIFTSAGFNGLEDYSFRLPPITNQGRPNPFTTLGSDSGTPAFPVTPPPNNNPPADEPPQNDNPPAGNGVTTNGATAITKNGATLSGQITGGTPTARWFEWGRTSSLGNLTPQISANITGTTFTYTLSTLTPGITYYYKAAAKMGGTNVYGSVLNFTTSSN